jgi:hypothetical protein
MERIEFVFGRFWFYFVGRAVSMVLINRLLSKQRYFEEFIGAYGAQDRSVHVVHEDPSTEATQKLPKERMFRKKSNMAKMLML